MNHTQMADVDTEAATFCDVLYLDRPMSKDKRVKNIQQRLENSNKNGQFGADDGVAATPVVMAFDTTPVDCWRLQKTH